jgi:adenosyl cobinamide kinase/adenosyl cobinamide phosphate guanylyltransferase
VGGVTLLVGGARSGKSALAVEIARRHLGDVVVVATAEPFDDDLRDRIERHRADRPGWPTVEAPVELADALASIDDHAMVVLDCLTVWVGNLFHHLPDVAERDARYDALLAAFAARRAPTVVVSNEVGMGVHPGGNLAREYRDELGRLNQRVAAIADTSLLLVAGRALTLRSPFDLL